jgi:uncharacterized protein with GYD domain
MKMLIAGKYTSEGAKGLVKEGGSKRKAAVEKAIKGLGGKLESIYYAYGEADVYAVVDMPDSTSALALSLVINASGAVHVKSIPLITVEEVDAACKKSVDYRPAGA